eukprot:926819-Alexandrium_andersonii.AAC.1
MASATTLGSPTSGASPLAHQHRNPQGSDPQLPSRSDHPGTRKGAIPEAVRKDSTAQNNFDRAWLGKRGPAWACAAQVPNA